MTRPTIGILYILFSIAIGIALIISGNNYDNDDDNTFMDIGTWLIVDGACMIIIIPTIIMMLHATRCVEFMFSSAKCLQLIYAIFYLSWAIVGSILLSETNNSNISTVMMAAVILAFIGSFSVLIF